MGFILVIISILFMATPTAITFNIQYGNCVILFWSQIGNSPILLYFGFIFIIALFLYFLSSFVLLPISGLIMAIKVVKIKKNSRKLIRQSNKQNHRNKQTRDIKILISQIIISNFAVIFNLPMAIISVLNIEFIMMQNLVDCVKNIIQCYANGTPLALLHTCIVCPSIHEPFGLLCNSPSARATCRSPINRGSLEPLLWQDKDQTRPDQM